MKQTIIMQRKEENNMKIGEESNGHEEIKWRKQIM